MEQEVIADIARRVKKTGRYTETAELMAKSMIEQGYSAVKIQAEVMKMLRADKEYEKAVAENTKAYKQEIQNIIDKTLKRAEKAGEMLIEEAGNMAWNNDLSIWQQHGVNLKYPNTLKQLIDSFRLQTVGELKNLTRSMGFKNTALGKTGVLQAFQREMDLATIKVATGVFSYDVAVNDCIKRLAASGLRSIDYASGRSYQLDTAARMCVRTGTSQLAGKITEINLKDTDHDLVITSQHMGSRPEHVPIQNRVFSFGGKNKKYPDFQAPIGKGGAGYGLPDGIKGSNCTHDFYPYWEGDYIPPDVEPNEQYYKNTQKQRAMERGIRATKREIEAQKAVGGDTKELKAKLKKQKADYYAFSNQVGIRPKDNRLKVVSGSSDFTKSKVYNRIQKKEIASRESQYKAYLANLSSGDITLRKKQKEVLKKVPKAGDWNYFRNKEVDIKDLAALTAATGDEFALFAGKNGKIVIHGNSMKWNIPEEAWNEIKNNQMIWIAHSHPTITKLRESPEDIETLKLFTWQKKSSIIDLQGNIKEFDADMQRWFNEMLGVK